MGTRMSSTSESLKEAESKTLKLKHPVHVKFDYAPTVNKIGLQVSGLYGDSDLAKNDIVVGVNGYKLHQLDNKKMDAVFISAVMEAKKRGDKTLDLEIIKMNPKLSKSYKRSSKMFTKKKLPLPPEKEIKMVLWDMDNTFLAFHTRGVWFEPVEDLVEQVTLPFLDLVPRLLKAGFQVGVVTFSDAEVAEAYSDIRREGLGGEDLVTPLVEMALTKSIINSASSTAEEKKNAAKIAKNAVKELYIVGAFPEFRNQMHEFKNEEKMPYSKHWHIERVKDMHQKKYPDASRIKNSEILFFDDSLTNVEEAKKEGVWAHHVDPDIAFTDEDWLEAIAAIK